MDKKVALILAENLVGWTQLGEQSTCRNNSLIMAALTPLLPNITLTESNFNPDHIAMPNLDRKYWADRGDAREGLGKFLIEWGTALIESAKQIPPREEGAEHG